MTPGYTIGKLTSFIQTFISQPITSQISQSAAIVERSTADIQQVNCPSIFTKENY